MSVFEVLRVPLSLLIPALSFWMEVFWDRYLSDFSLGAQVGWWVGVWRGVLLEHFWMGMDVNWVPWDDPQKGPQS